MAKNKHLEHLEDDIFNSGTAGVTNSINFLKSLRDMLTEGDGGTPMKVLLSGMEHLLLYVAEIHSHRGSLLVLRVSLTKLTLRLYTVKQMPTDSILIRLWGVSLKSVYKDYPLYLYKVCYKVTCYIRRHLLP